MTTVFIDGSAGTTGLRIYDRLSEREDIGLIILPDEFRKDPAARKKALNEADIAFLCLPDAAAQEACCMTENPHTVLIDTSTKNRTDPGFVYGFPEITGYDRIAASKRIANPGCHASGFIALVYPLVKAGIIDSAAKLSCFSLTGYSGGGKKTIAGYNTGRNADRQDLLSAPRMYGLTQQHKHLKEMTYVCGLEHFPVFSPVICDFYSGMEVNVPLFADQLNLTGLDEALESGLTGIDSLSGKLAFVYRSFYKGALVHFDENADEDGYLSAAVFSGRDDMQISISGNEERLILTARFDNLGKGASGSAIQNMNIVLGKDETTGLVL